MISIILPVYNGDKYIEKCIRSVILQAYKDWETIIVDDGSTDKTAAICESLSMLDSRIKYYYQQNAGVSDARNRAISLAQGEWLYFVDADDMLAPGCLEIILKKAFESKQNIVLSNSLRVDGCKEKELLRLNDSNCEPFLPIKHYALWGYLIKRDIITKNDIRFVPGLAFSEDRVFLYELSHYQKEMAITSEITYMHVINDDSVCQRSNPLKKLSQHLDAENELIIIRDKYFNDRILFSCVSKEIEHVHKLGMHLFVSSPEYKISLIKDAHKCYVQKGKTSRNFIVNFLYWQIRCVLRNIKSKFKI